MFVLTKDVEIIVAFLPKSRRQLALPDLIDRLVLSAAAVGDTLFEDLHGQGEISLGRFPNQQMEVLRHDDITPHREPILLPGFFEDFEKKIAAMR